MKDGEPRVVPAAAQPFETFIARHQALMERRARNLCRGHYDADEVVQRTRIIAFQHYHQLRDPSRGEGWLVKILMRAFFDLVEGQRRDLGNVPVEAADAEALPAEAPSVYDSITSEQLLACVSRLPGEQQQCYRLKELDGLNYNEISARLGIPKNTVGTRILRARKRLHEMLLALIGEEAA